MDASAGEYRFNPSDFDHPSFWFKMGDRLSNLCCRPLLYRPYYRTFGLKGDENVLDFGCGGGVGSCCLAEMLKKDGRLTCVDTSDYWVKKAAGRLRKYPNAACQAGDIRSLDLPALSYDVISIIFVLHDITPAERGAIVKALAELLHPEGTAFICEPVKKSHGMPSDEIRAIFTEAGLQEASFTESKSQYRGVFKHS